MRRLLFVSIGSLPFGPSAASICMSAAVHATGEKGAGVKMEFLDELSPPATVEEIFWEILDRDPDLVALSAYSWNAHAVAELIDGLLEVQPRLHLLVGGPGVGLLPNRRPSVSYCGTEDGEVALLEYLGLAGDLPRGWTPLSGHPYSQRPDDYVTDYPRKEVICFDSSRGCPFTCTFCVDGDVNRPQRRRPASAVRKELLHLVDSGYRVIDVADNNANYSPETFDAYLAVADERPSAGIHLEVRPELFSERSARRAAGLKNVQMFMGVQSGNASELARVGRRNSEGKIDKVLGEWLGVETRKCTVGVDLIFGLPSQTRLSFIDSLNRVAGFAPNKVVLNLLREISGVEAQRKTDDGVLPLSMGRGRVATSTMTSADFAWFARLKLVVYRLQAEGHILAAAFLLCRQASVAPGEFLEPLAAPGMRSIGRQELLRCFLARSASCFGPARASVLKEVLSVRPPDGASSGVYSLFRLGEDWALRAALRRLQ